MKILVTGGAGFIGSHLCEKLLELEHSLSVIDNLSTGNLKNLGSCINELEFFESNIENFDLESLKDIDCVVHLAAQTSVPLSIQDFKTSSTSNLTSSIKIIDYSCKNNIPLIFASSAAVYGNLKNCDDSIKEYELLSPYAADKFFMEQYANLCYSLYGLSNIGLRFFNVYGPRQDPHSSYSGVISIFCDKLITGNNITIYGGEQTRDFIYVEDAVTSILNSIKLSKNSKICERINVLTGDSTSINSIANILFELTNSTAKKIYKDLLDGDPIGSPGTTAQMQDLLDIRIKNMIKIREGLSKTIQSLKR